jgi:hypothetical protein
MTARWLVWKAVGVLMLATLAGCGDGKIRRYPVTGTVLVDGKPAEGAIVIFCPVNATGELENLRPFGKADASGTFQLTTVDVNDGAPAGDYKIIAQWPAPPPQGEVRDGRPPTKGPDRLKGKYYDLDSTPLSAKVEERSNTLPPFDLKSK